MVIDEFCDVVDMSFDEHGNVTGRTSIDRVAKVKLFLEFCGFAVLDHCVHRLEYLFNLVFTSHIDRVNVPWQQIVEAYVSKLWLEV